MKRLFIIIGSLQLATMGIAGAQYLGFEFPFVRQVTFFIYLTFVPGLLILKTIGVQRLFKIESLLYAVGLSLAVLMFAGLLANSLYPALGISSPISFLPLYITVSILVSALCCIILIRNRHEQDALRIKLKGLCSTPFLFLLILPLLSIVGARVMNLSGNNVILLILIAMISLVTACVAFGRFIPPAFYPLAILSISISLLFHQSFITDHIFGWDIHQEYYWQNQVIINGVWNNAIYSNVNSMLSTTMLVPAYSILLDMDSVWVFKIIIPIIYSLVPLTLFELLRKQLNDSAAFLAAFFFMSFYTFFSEMLQLPRQQIAELFLILSVLLLINQKIPLFQRVVLLMVFGLCLVVSHYGTTYIYMFYLITSLCIIKLLTFRPLTQLPQIFKPIQPKAEEKARAKLQHSYPWVSNTKSGMLNITYVGLIVILGISWYLFIGSGSAVNSIVSIGQHVFDSIAEVMNPNTKEQSVLFAIGLAAPTTNSVQREIFRILQYLTQLFIIIGVIKALVDSRKEPSNPAYLAMIISSSILLFMSIVLPFFSGALNMSRIYHLTLFFLASSFMLGSLFIFGLFFQKKPKRENIGLRLTTILIVIPYFLFNIGFIYQISNDIPTSIALNNQIDYPRYNQQDVAGAKWASTKRVTEPVYADNYGSLLLNEYFYENQRSLSSNSPNERPALIYLRSWNIDKSEILIYLKTGSQQVLGYIDISGNSEVASSLKNGDLVYSSGKSRVINLR